MRQEPRYIPRATRVGKGGGHGTQDPVPADRGGDAGNGRPRGRGELAEALTDQLGGGSGGPPAGAALRILDPVAPPGERTILRIGVLTFRVWTDRPEASAEYRKDGVWTWTPIPSIAVLQHPRAEAVSLEDLDAPRAR